MDKKKKRNRESQQRTEQHSEAEQWEGRNGDYYYISINSIREQSTAEYK